MYITLELLATQNFRVGLFIGFGAFFSSFNLAEMGILCKISAFLELQSSQNFGFGLLRIRTCAEFSFLVV